jgi:hypothetical protein
MQALTKPNGLQGKEQEVHAKKISKEQPRNKSGFLYRVFFIIDHDDPRMEVAR